MSSILDLNLSDTPDLAILDAGAEAELQIVGAETYDDVSSKGFRISVRCDVIGEPNVATIWHTIWLPNEHDDERQRDNKARNLRRFITAIGEDSDRSIGDVIDDLSNWTGCGFSVILGVDEEYNPDEPRNVVKKLVR